MAIAHEEPPPALDGGSHPYPYGSSPSLGQPQHPGELPPDPLPRHYVPQHAELSVQSRLLGSSLRNTDGRALIGNALRIPLVWCQFGSCIARFTDPAALGESDIQSRAVAAGWRRDALGRLACPECVQREPMFMVTYPLVQSWARTDVSAAPGPSTGEVAPATSPSAWDTAESPRMNLAVMGQSEPERLAWWRRREAGRHR
jgi:hypothetical protein